MKITEETLYEQIEKARELWLESLPLDEEIPEHLFSEEFEGKMQSLLNNQKNFGQQRTKLHYLQKVAVAILALLIVASSAIALNTSTRKNVLEIITRAWKNKTEYTTSGEKEEAPASTEKLPEIELGYLPDEMKETDRKTGENFECISYKGENEMFFDLTWEFSIENSRYTDVSDAEELEPEMFYMGKTKAWIKRKEGESIIIIIWNQDGISYRLTGNLDVEEMKKIAKKVREKY
jgi:hypothetical protein